jgi:hypothetical protein
MKRFRFSIAGLMRAVVVIAIGMAALRYASPLWAAAVFLSVSAVHALSVLGAVCIRGQQRAYHLGRSVFGWGYLVIVYSTWHYVPPDEWLPTTKVLSRFEVAIGPRKPWGFSMSTAIRPAVLTYDTIRPRATLAAMHVKSRDYERPAFVPVQLCGFPGGPIYYLDTERQAYYQIGHCIWSLLAALLGGVLARGAYGAASDASADVVTAVNCAPQPKRSKLCAVLVSSGILIAVALYASFIIGSEVAVDAIVLATYGMLCFALLGVLSQPLHARPPWVGAALFGWGYLLAAIATPALRDSHHDTILPSVFSESTIHDACVALPCLPRALRVLEDTAARNRTPLRRAVNQRVYAPAGNHEVTLSELVAILRTVTRSAELPNGIPIYVESVGLQEAEKTLSSTAFLCIKATGVTIRSILEQFVEQLDMECYVSDGMVVITHRAPEIVDCRRWGHCSGSATA